MVERIIRSSRAWSIVIFAGMCLLATLLVLHSPEHPLEQQQVQAQEPPPPPGGGTDTPDLATCEADINGCPVYYTCGNVPFDTMPGPGGCPTDGCPCSGTPGTGPQGGRDGQNPGLVSYAASVIDNWSFNYVHQASDYAPITARSTSSGGTGCSSCGGSNPAPSLPESNPWATFGLTRQFRSRDLGQIGSFGPGGFCTFDTKIHAFLDPEYQDPEGGADVFIDLFDPTRQHPVRLLMGTQSGVFLDTRMESFQDLSTYDDQDALTGDLAGMVTAELTTWTGEKFVFEIVDAGPEYIGLENFSGTTVRDGRLTRIEDRNGYGITVNYKSWTAQELTESPERQWQIDTVVSDRGETATFSYGTTQVGGLWAISQIDLPNGESITYDYSGDRLTGVTHPDGTQSSFTYTAGTTITTVDIMDAAADGTHRAKTVYLTNNTNNYPGFEDDFIINSASLMVRLVANENDEVIYWNKPSDDILLDSFCYVYEGAGNMRVVSANSTAYLEDGWYYDDTNQEILGNEDAGTTYTGGLETGAPTSIVDERGLTTTYQYDSDSWMTRKSYADATFESWCYNSLHQVTRYKDRNDNVTLYTYDSNGNMLTKAVGLTNDPSNVDDDSDPYNILTYDPCATNDVQTDEYAVYEWQYYGPTHANAYMLSAYIDANGNQTDYEYDANNRLTKIIQPADAPGAIRAETVYTYDTAGRLSTVTGPDGGVTTSDYDTRGRVTKLTYGDGTTERFFYGAAGSGDENLVVKTKDRRGVVTNYEYDASGRRTKTTFAAAVMDLNDNESAVSDPSVTIEETCAYLTGTDLRASCVRAGEKTDYTYDYRHRVVTTTVYPNTATTLTTTNTYVDNQLFETEDPYGRSTFYAYDAIDGRLIRQIKATVPGVTYTDETAVLNATRNTDPASNSTVLVVDYIYDAEGNPTRVVDPRGIEHHTQYDSRGRVTAHIQAAQWADQSATSVSARTETDYDDEGNVVEVRHPRYFDSNDTNGYQKAKTTMTYNGRNVLASRTEAPGTPEVASESFTYTPEGRLDTRTDFRGNDWTNLYPLCCGRQIVTTDPLGHGTITNTDSARNVTHQAWVDDAASHANYHDPDDAKTLREVTTQYDERGRRVAQTRWLIARGVVDPNAPPIAGDNGVPATEGLTTRWAYDDDLDDGVGLDAQFGSHVAGLNLTGDADGSAELETDPDGVRTLRIADAVGRPIRTVHLDATGAALSSNTTTYDIVVTVNGFGDVVETTTANATGAAERLRTDSLNRLVESIDAANQVTSRTYDANGNELSIRDPNGIGYDYTYDAVNARITSADTQGTSQSFVHDTAGNLIRQTESNEFDSWAFDARNRLIQTTDRNSDVRSITYDANGNPMGRTDADGYTTTTVFDERGRAIETVYADHVATSNPGDADYDRRTYTYDGAGLPAVSADQFGNTCTYIHDLAGRLIRKDYRLAANSPSGPVSDSDDFTYSAGSRLLSAVSGRYGNTAQFAYDAGGRRVTESLTIGGQTYTIAKQYDAANRLATITYPDGTSVTRAYTNRDQLDSIYRESALVASFTYDIGMRETQRSYGNGITTQKSYVANANLLSAITVNGDPGMSSTYSYDADHNLSARTFAGVLAGFSLTAAVHDAANRLTSWQTSDGRSQSWTLTGEGDWTSTSIDGVTQNRTHNAVHELTAIDGAAISYDPKGNVTTDELGREYDWDPTSRLSSTSLTGETISYTHDALQRRVSKTTVSGTTVYVPAQHAEGEQTYAEYASGTPPGSPLRTYIYGTQLNEPVLKVEGAAAHYYHHDHQLSTVGLTDGSGAAVERYAYNAYGEPTILEPDDGSPDPDQISDVANPFLYCGYRFDSESGLYYCRLRMYSPRFGRFVQRDPLGFVDGLSLYQYSGSQPLMLTDPTGGCSKPTAPSTGPGGCPPGCTHTPRGMRNCHQDTFNNDDMGIGYDVPANEIADGTLTNRVNNLLQQNGCTEVSCSASNANLTIWWCTGILTNGTPMHSSRKGSCGWRHIGINNVEGDLCCCPSYNASGVPDADFGSKCSGYGGTLAIRCYHCTSLP